MRPALRLPLEYTYRDILDAYLDCRRRKRTTRSAMGFETNFEASLGQLLEDINNGSYTIGRSRVFVVTYPKAREVWAAGFRDRIVHHLIYRDIGPWYEAGFIEDSFSCIKGRGTLAAIRRTERHARKVTHGWTKPAWCLQADIANFFVSINKDTLWDILRADLGEDSITSRLAKQVVFHDCTRNTRSGTPHLAHLVPKHKSLWHCEKGCGLPIGNLTSQFFSNVYLDALDKFVKHTLRVKHYARYVDDIVLFSKDAGQLSDWTAAMDEWLRSNRGLYFHPRKTSIRPADAGVNFVGGYILPWRTYPRRTTVHSAMSAARALRDSPCDAAAMDKAISYLGIMRHTHAFDTRKRVCTTAALPGLISHDNEYTKVFYQ